MGQSGEGHGGGSQQNLVAGWLENGCEGGEKLARWWRLPTANAAVVEVGAQKVSQDEESLTWWSTMSEEAHRWWKGDRNHRWRMENGEQNSISVEIGVALVLGLEWGQ